MIVNGHTKSVNGPISLHDLAGLGVDDRQHRRLPGAQEHGRSVARKDRLARPSHDVDRRQQRSVRRIDHVPLRRAERRRINRRAIGRQREAIAAVPVVGFLPDDFFRHQVESGKTLDRADEQTPCARAGRDAADQLGLLPGSGRPRRDAFDEAYARCRCRRRECRRRGTRSRYPRRERRRTGSAASAARGRAATAKRNRPGNRQKLSDDRVIRAETVRRAWHFDRSRIRKISKSLRST